MLCANRGVSRPVMPPTIVLPGGDCLFEAAGRVLRSWRRAACGRRTKAAPGDARSARSLPRSRWRRWIRQFRIRASTIHRECVELPPQWVLLTHPKDKITELTADFRPAKATARFPAPIGPKSRSMPAKDGVRLNNASQTEHAWPEPGHEHQQRSSAQYFPQTGTLAQSRHHPRRCLQSLPARDFLSLFLRH
jgi:hypothetical protein